MRHPTGNPPLRSLLLLMLLLLAACGGGARPDPEQRPAPAPAPPREAPGSEDAGKNPDGFVQAGMPTPVTGAYLTAYRDPPVAGGLDSPDVLVYAVVRDAAGRPLPKPLAFDEAVARFADQTVVNGEVDADPTRDYHLRFRIPRDRLVAESIGRDRIDGVIRVRTPAVAAPSLETSIVIWIANVALLGERGDFGTLVVAPEGAPAETIRLNVLVGSKEPARNALLKGLGGELAVVGGSCPRLSESEPAELTADCTVELAPTGVALLDRVVTLSYHNGVRSDFASAVIRGESAVVLGQPDGLATTRSADRRGMDEPTQVAVRDGKLLVVDSRNDRVLIWNRLPRRSHAPADVVVGRGPDPAPYRDAGGFWVYPTSAASLVRPAWLESDGRKLIVADTARNRLLIWSKIPTADAAPADVVVGSSSFAGIVGADAQTSVSQPVGLTWDGQRMIAVPRYGAAKVWDGLPAANLAPSTATVGSTYRDPGSGGTFDRAVGRIHFDGQRYIEALDDRIRIFDAWPFDYDKPALVLGEADPAKHTSRSNTKATAAFSDGRRLIAARQSAVHVWTEMPTSASTPPDYVVGQPDALTWSPETYGAGIDSLNEPQSAVIDGDTLIIADTMNSRVILRPMPGPRPELEPPQRLPERGDGEVAPGLVHFPQRYLQLGIVNVEAIPVVEVALVHSGTTPVRIEDVSFDSDGLGFAGGAFPGKGGTCKDLITESCTLRFALSPRKQGGVTARVVYGNGYETRDTVVTVFATLRQFAKRTLPFPLIGEALGVGDRRYPAIYTAIAPGGPGRILGYDPAYCSVMLVTDDAAKPRPPVVVGLVNNPENRCLLSDVEWGVGPGFVEGSRLYLVNPGMRRVSVWRTLPEVTNTPPDFVMGSYFWSGLEAFGRFFGGGGGQLDVWSALPDASGVAPGLRLPGVRDGQPMLIDGKLVVGVYTNEGTRLNVWNAPPATATTPPDRVVEGFFKPGVIGEEIDDYYGLYSMATDGERLFIADSGRNRILVWNGIPQPGQRPDMVLGQLNYRGEAANDGGFGLWSFNLPTNIFVQDGELFVVDRLNRRIVIYDVRRNAK